MLKRTLPAVAAALLVVSSPRGPTPSRRSTPPGRPPARLRCAPIRVARAARAHSRDMVARRYFAHVTPAGSTLSMRVVRLRVDPRAPPLARWARRSAWGSGPLASPDAIVAAWLDSPAHRRIALARRWRVVGIGVASGTPFATPGATFTADFGT